MFEKKKEFEDTKG